MKKNESNAVAKNITLPKDLLDRADEYAKKNFLSRSGLMALALKTYLDSQQVIPVLQSMSILMKNAQDNGSLTPEEQEKFKSISSFVDLISEK